MRYTTHQAGKTTRTVSVGIRRLPRRFGWMFAVIVVAGCTLVFAVRAYNRRLPAHTVTDPSERPRASQPSKPDPSRIRTAGESIDPTQYVNHGRIWPQLQEALNILGDRLERPGKERVVLNGVMTRNLKGESVSSTALVIWELPGRLRIEENNGGRVTVSGFNGTTAWKSAGVLGAEDQGLFETLLYDSAEHFFIGQAKGFATRALGGRFTSDDRTEEKPGEAVHDIYAVTDQIAFGTKVRHQRKLYCLNSDSELLEIVKYTLDRDGAPVRVEVRLADWRTVSGQRVAGSIVRYEDGKEVMSLRVSSTGVGPRVADNAFDRP